MIMSLMEKAFIKAAEYDVIDMFAGKCAVSRAFRAKGFSTAALDVELDDRDAYWLQDGWRSWFASTKALKLQCNGNRSGDLNVLLH